MSNDRTLSLSTVTAAIHAPIEKINIADWLFHLPDAAYQRCAHAHIAAGTATTDDGRGMSINVESIGDALVVQHYVAEYWFTASTLFANPAVTLARAFTNTFARPSTSRLIRFSISLGGMVAHHTTKV